VTASGPLVGTFTADTSLTVRTWDDALARATGIDPAQAIGQALVDVIPSIATRGLLPRFEQAVASGAVHVFSPGLHRYLVPCAPTVPSPRFAHMQQRVTLGPLREGDRIVGVLVAIEDVTERLDAERDLAEALAAGADDWKTRRAMVQRLSQAPTADFALSLVGIIKAHHHDFSVLSSSLQLLAGTDVDVSEALAGLLRDADPDLRIQAALALGQQRAPAAVEALIGALDDSHVNVRFQAIESLGRLRASAAVDPLLRLAESGDGYLAFAAIDALGAIRDPRGAAALVPLLDREDVRPAVISALGTTGDETAVTPLVRVLNTASDAAVPVAEAITSIYHRLERSYQQGGMVANVVATGINSAGVRHLIDAVDAAPDSATSAIRVLGWVPADDARLALVKWLALPVARPTVVEVLPAHGEAVVGLLLDQLAAPDTEVQRAAVVALGQLALPRATPALVALIDRAPDLSAAVAGALARIGDPEAFEGLVALLGHSDIGVRQAAVGALNSLGHPSMPARIEALLDSDNPLVRESAVRIAGYFGYPSVRDRILQLTADPAESVQCAALESVPFFDGGSQLEVVLSALRSRSPGVRSAAVRALGHLDDNRARHALVEALSDEVFWVRYFAARALADQRHVDALAALTSAALNDPAPPVRVAATEALGALYPDRASAVFVRLADEAVDEIAAAAVAALARDRSDAGRATVRRAVRDQRRMVRLAAITALTAMSGDDTAQVLQQVAVTDSEPEVRSTAVDALGDLARQPDAAGDEAAAMLVAMLTDAERCQDAAAALARLPAARLAAVARQLHHPDPLTRRAVVEMLGRSRHSEATTLLFDALSDESASVREAAMLALGRRRHVV
jgi:HEAT repeat protein